MSMPLSRTFPDRGTQPRLHHLEGAPVRAAICAAELFAQATSGPAAAPINLVIDKRLWSVPCVYCLLWLNDSAPFNIYVGSTKDPVERLTRHEREGWDEAILLTGHGLTRGAALQMEYAVGRVIRDSSRARRQLTPVWDNHPTPWQADMAWTLLEPLVVLLDLCLGELQIHAGLDPARARLISRTR